MKPSIEACAHTSSAPPAPSRQMRASRVGGGAARAAARAPGAAGGSRMSSERRDGGGEAEPGEGDEGRVEPLGVDQAGQRQRGHGAAERQRHLADAEGEAALGAREPAHDRAARRAGRARAEHAGDEQGDEERRVARRQRRADERRGAARQPAGHDRALADAVGERAPRHEREHPAAGDGREGEADLAEAEAELGAQGGAERGQAHPQRRERAGARPRPWRGSPSGSARSRRGAPRALAVAAGLGLVAAQRHRAPAPAPGRRAVVEARRARRRGADADARRLRRRAQHARGVERHGGQRAPRPGRRGSRSPRTGVPSSATAQLRPRAGVRQPASMVATAAARRGLVGERRLHAGVDRLAQLARLAQPRAASPRRLRARAGARTSHRPRSSGVTSVSTRRRQRSRSVLTRSIAGRPPSQYHHSAPLARGSASSSGRSRRRRAGA